MFFILSQECGDYVLAYVFSIIKPILRILQMAAPIVLIVSLSITITKQLLSGGENKKITKGMIGQIIALFIFFLLPWMVGAVLQLIVIDNFDEGGVSYTLGSCWEQAEELTGEIKQAEDKAVGNGNTGTSLNTNTGSNQTGSSQSQTPQSPATRIFIGDSRTVGMHSAVRNNQNDIWSCLSSQGLSWMKKTGVPQIEDKIGKNTAVIILMGVNDLGNVDKYITYINQQESKWRKKGAKTYFVSVMPTDGNRSDLNTKINSFNKKMKNNLSKKVQYIDANSYLKSKGFKTTDGLHYTNDTYQKIYQYIQTKL